MELSVIIPMYKGKDYIESTVSEVCKINIGIEVLVVDDGSPDGSYEYALEIFKEKPEVKVIRKDNGGIADARNYGLNLAKGEYILFVDQDDRVNPDTVRKAIRLIKENGYSAVMWSTRFEYCDGTNRICDKVYSRKVANKEMIQEIIIPSMLSREKNGFSSYTGHIWGGVFKKRIINDYNINLKRFVDYEDDLLFVFDFLLNADSVLFIPDVGYYWMTNLESYSHSNKYIDDYISRSENYRDYLSKEYKSKTGHYLDSSVLTYFNQYNIIGSIKNCCGEGNNGISDVVSIIKSTRESKYRRAFAQECTHIHDKRERFTYYMIKSHLTLLAIMFAKIYSSIRRKWEYK